MRAAGIVNKDYGSLAIGLSQSSYIYNLILLCQI